MISSRYQNNAKPILDLNPVQLKLKNQVEEKVSSGHYQFENINCAICDDSNFFQLSNKDRYGLYCSNVICQDCGLVMINPRMTEAAYNEFYNHEYRTLYSGINSNAANFFKAQNSRGKRLYEYLESKKLIAQPSRLAPFALEVGCGAGGILNYFRSKGFEVKGIDLGKEYLSYGKEEHQLDLEVGTISDIELSRKPDVIIYSHVLEHVLDLNQELSLLANICSKDTLVYIEVPGLRNLALGYRSDPLRYFQNAHTYSFSLTSLRNLFVKHNFELLFGDEFVKAVFKLNDAAKSKSIQNDYHPLLKSLRKAESIRKYYFLSFARFRVIVNAIIQKLKLIVTGHEQ